MSSEQSGRHFKGALLLLATAFVLLLSMGWWGGSQYAARLDGEKRVRLLRHAADIAGYIKPDLIKELSFTVADGGTPVFERLREQLINEAKMIPSARWVYSMADLDGLIVFGPESTPLDDPQYSPPGTSYHNPPKELLIAFKQKRLVTAGPYTDEWGTFISAFAPVLDPYSGRVLMVIGIDIKADDWQAAINAGWQLPYMVTLVLLLVLLLAVGWYINRIKLDILRLRHWIIAVAAMPMLAGLALNGAYEYWELKETSSRTILLTTEHVQSSWNRMVASHVQLMEVQSHQIASTQKILKAWQQRDLPALTALAQPVFEQLKLEYGITHFNFITPENTCFLRMHKPELPADIMERGARLPAQSTAGDFWGIDLDPAGDCALRYAMPWKQDGKVIGYLELGIEIAHLTRQLSAEMNLDLLAVIRKEYITRNKFEAGRRMFGFAGQWDDYPDFVVTQQTGQYMLQEAAAWIKQHPRTGTEDDIFNVKQGKEHFACSLIRLPDAAGREVAYIILMLNVTAEVDAAWSNLLLNIGLAVTVCGGVLVLLWSIFGMAERRLTATFAETKESDDNFRNFFESVTDMIMVSTPGGQLLYSNAAVSRTLGYTRDELGRMHLLDLCPADKRPESRKFYQSNLKGNWENGLLLARRDGGIVPAETRVWPGRWSGADCIFSISKDLTGVQEEQQRFELLFRNNPALIAISTLPDQRFADINDAFLKVLGYSRGDVIGKTAAGLGLFEYPQLQAAAADTLSADRYISNVEMQVRRRDGTILDGLFSGDVFSIHGKQYSMTVMIDITERKRAADALQSQSSLQQLLMEIGTQYINLPLDDVEAAINTSMIKLAEFVRADRAYTFAYDFDQQICINTREWCAAGITPQINELQAVPLAAVPDWVKAHQCGESIYVPDVLSLPSGGLRDILEPQGIKSLLAVPLMSRNECIGFVGFDSVLQHHNYSDKEQDLLLVFAQMLVNVEQRKQSEEARRVSEERLEQLAEQSRTIAWEVNLQGLYTYISRAAGPVLGYMPAEIIGKLHFYDLHPESGRDEFKLAAFAGFERKEPFHDLINQVQAKDGRQLWVATNGIPLLNADGTLRGYRGSDTDITERQLAEYELQSKAAFLEAQVNASRDGILVIDENNKRVLSNRRFTELLNIPPHIQADADDTAQLEYVLSLTRYPEQFLQKIIYLNSHVNETSQDEIEFKNGMVLDRYSAPVLGKAGECYGRIWTFHDITERKQAEAYQEMGRTVLEILNEPGDFQHSIQCVLDALKTRTGVDAVGIRLKNGDDFPYIAQEGFPDDFLLTENSLIERNATGGLCLDNDGNVCLECTCGLVIAGKCDPASPSFTPGGSFWTNDSLQLQDIPPGENPRYHPRNQCIHHGYSSVALIPVRYKNTIVGLIQLNDRRKGCLSMNTVEILEGIASHIGEAMVRKQMEEGLRQSEAKFRSYFELLLTGRAITSPEKGWTDVNAALCDMLGYAKAELMQMTWAELTHPDDLPADVTQFNRILSGEIESYMLDKRFICKDGHHISTRLAVQCLRRQDRTADYFVAIIIDISELKQKEAQLQFNEHRFRSMFKLSPVPLALNDMNGSIIYLNDRFIELFGYTPADIPSTKEWFLLAYPDARYREKIIETWGEMITKASRDGSDIEPVEYKVTCKDGTVRAVEISGIIIEGNLLVRLLDMTARRREEAELIKAKEKAEESDRLKTAFLNNLSHEIRTPFNGILGFLSILQDADLPPRERDEYFRMINKSAERLMDTIDDTVEIAKIQTGQVKITCVETDINRLSRDLFEQFKPQAELKGLNFTMNNSLCATACNIKTDDEKLNTVLNSLLNNAIKFTSTGAIEFGLRKKADCVEFSVKDTGIGIPVNKQQALFNIFMQADVSNTRKFEGSGLGLAIAQAHVKMLGGDIRFESQEGQGTTFYVTLPYQLTEPGKVCDPQPETPEVVMHAQQFLKILVAEDDEINFDYVNVILTKANYVILHAWTGVEAVELCRNHTDIGIILMDIKMPVMDGYIATREIRKFNLAIPIIAITAYAAAGDRQNSLDAGMNDYVSKPIKPQALLAVLDKWVPLEYTR